MAREKATNDIPIEDFDQEVHDPEEYFERFESAMELATGVTDDARKAVLLKKWLQIKLNAAARMILKSCDMSAEWEALIAEFKSKLITPQDRYNWRSGKRKITWDGRESFHVLAERVKRTVDRYEDQPREKDYFYEFCQARKSKRLKPQRRLRSNCRQLYRVPTRMNRQYWLAVSQFHSSAHPCPKTGWIRWRKTLQS